MVRQAWHAKMFFVLGEGAASVKNYQSNAGIVFEKGRYVVGDFVFYLCVKAALTLRTFDDVP